ncbi:restriction system-associated AAA family ATPase [Desulforhopalus sp. 52FAK]
MKLLRLKIDEPFRSLQAGFELHFLREWDLSENLDKSAPYVLAGPNGSGKSNVLELLAAIFYHLECQFLEFRPTSFDYDKESNPEGFRDEQATPNGFKLEYQIEIPDHLRNGVKDEYAHIKVVKSIENTKVGAELYWINNDEYGVEKPLPRTNAKALLPDYVLGYSSGENEILSLPFFKMRFIQLDEYLESLRERLSYPGRSESRHTYLDNTFSQAILLCNLLFQDDDTLEPFRQEVGVESLQQFRIILKLSIAIPPDQLSYFNSFPDELVFKGVDDANREVIDFDILAGFTDLVERLKNCATSFYHDVEANTLCLDYWVNKSTKDAFKNNFEKAIDLFQAFQILLTLNLYSVSEELKKDLYTSNSLYVTETVPILPSDERVMRFKDVVLKKKGVDGVCYAKSLSDGEHQFLHSLGLFLLYKDTNSLFLLDEPETHFNPEWRSNFITRLRDCFSNADTDKEREVLITTHTPFLISDSKKEQVLIFKNENGEVEVNRPEYNTLGASVDQITMLSFDKSETIGGYATTKIKEFENRFYKDENREDLIKEINRELGDSIEKMLLIKTIRKSLKEK